MILNIYISPISFLGLVSPGDSEDFPLALLITL